MDNAPPQKFIDWWLSKSLAERRSFLDDPDSSDAVKVNLAALESYCLSHNYEVFSKTALRPRPFPRHVLSGGDASQPVYPAPDIFYTDPVNLGGRYLTAEERVQRKEQGSRHIHDVVGRTRDHLSQLNLGISTSRQNAVAAVLVDVLLRAVCAAAQRQQLADRIQRHESAEAKRKAHRLLKLRRDRDATSPLPERNVGMAAPILTSKTIEAYVRDVHGMLGMYLQFRRDGPPSQRRREADVPLWRALRQRLYGDVSGDEDSRQPVPGGSVTPPVPLVDRLVVCSQDVRFALNSAMTGPLLRQLLDS